MSHHSTRAVRRRRWVGATIVAALVAGVLTSGAGAATNLDNGVGTKAALNGPNCDAENNRLEVPYLGWVPCVKPWKDGDDNGGATSPGVTKDSIKVVLVALSDDAQRAALTPIRDRASGTFATMDDAVRDGLAIFTRYYETWGRDVDVTVFHSSGADEASQRADALAITAMKPFAVIDTISLNFMATELVKNKIMVIGGGQWPNRSAIEQSPYRWPVQIDSDATALLAAEFAGKALVGKPAKFAGSPDLQAKTRVFGTVRPVSPTAPTYEAALAEFKKRGGKMSQDLTYVPPADTSQITNFAQETAPTFIAKLKDAGVTSIFNLSSPFQMTQALTVAATAQDYYPEWILTGAGNNDTNQLSRPLDQKQWAHAFGISGLGPSVVDTSSSTSTLGWFNWFWSANAGVYNQSSFAPLDEFFAGVHMAGPRLTPKTFEAGMFSRPPVGGVAEKGVTGAMRAFGPNAQLPYNEYLVGGDGALAWWDPTAVLMSSTAAPATGGYRFVNQAKRYLSGDLPSKLPKFFDVAESLLQLPTLPENERPPAYPCEDCPSTGGTVPS